MSETKEAQAAFETELLLLWGVHAELTKVRGTFMKQWDLMRCFTCVREFLTNYADLETICLLCSKTQGRHLSLREYRFIIDQTFQTECSQEYYFQTLKHFHLYVSHYVEQSGYIGYSPNYSRPYLRPYLLLAYAIFIAPLDPEAGTAHTASQVLQEARNSYISHYGRDIEKEMQEAFLYCNHHISWYALRSDRNIFARGSSLDLDLQDNDNEGKQ